MNLLTDEIEDIAERIKLRIIAKGGTYLVYAKPSGVMSMGTPGEARIESHPDCNLVGCYTRTAQCADIEDDLRVRWREIAL